MMKSVNEFTLVIVLIDRVVMYIKVIVKYHCLFMGRTFSVRFALL